MTEYKTGKYGERMSRERKGDVWVLNPSYDNDVCPDRKEVEDRDVDIVHWKGYLYHKDYFKESHKQVFFY